MPDRDTGISNGTNSHSLNDTIAGTGPGIPDDALFPGEDGPPEAPTDEEVRRAAAKLGAPIAPNPD